jgi:hypothetical protein
LGRTHLRLVASEIGGSASIVDVDSGRVIALPQLRVSGPPSDYLSLTPTHGGALALVSQQACPHCALTQGYYLVRATGRVTRLASRHFPAFAGTVERIAVAGSTAEYVLALPHSGPCTLQLLPGTRPAVRVPCGDLGAIYPDGVAIWTHHDRVGLLVDPRTGGVRGHLNATATYDQIGHGLAISGPASPSLGTLRLINLATGTRRDLGWPSTLHFSYQLFPDPAGPYIAIEFADPAYPDYTRPIAKDLQTIGQAADLWLLNTRTDKLTHVPGFPILESLKQSGVAWTTDGRLVIVALGGRFSQPGRRTVVGVWRPGQPRVPVRTLPPLNGYTQLVPLHG